MSAYFLGSFRTPGSGERTFGVEEPVLELALSSSSPAGKTGSGSDVLAEGVLVFFVLPDAVSVLGAFSGTVADGVASGTDTSGVVIAGTVTAGGVMVGVATSGVVTAGVASAGAVAAAGTAAAAAAFAAVLPFAPGASRDWL